MANRVPPDPEQEREGRQPERRPPRAHPDWLDPAWEEWWGSRAWRGRLDRQLSHAEEAMQEFDYSRAVDGLAPWLMPSVVYLEALCSLATALCQTGACQDAETLYRFVLLWQPHDPTATSEYAFFLLDHQRPEEAELLCRQALGEYSDAPVLWEALARCLMDQDRYPEALEVLAEACRLDPEWAELYGLLALCHSALGEWEEGEAAWGRALALSPDDAALRWHYGLWLESRGEVEGALDYLLAVLEEHPGFPGAEGVYLVADCYRSLGRFKEAETLLRRFGLQEDGDADL